MIESFEARTVSHMTNDKTPTTMRGSFCARYRCPVEAFEEKLFWRGLYRHALPMAWIIRRASPEFFRRDEEFLRWLGETLNMADVRREIHSFRYLNRTCPHWLRTGFRICLSPSRVKAVAKRCFEE